MQALQRKIVGVAHSPRPLAAPRQPAPSARSRAPSAPAHPALLRRFLPCKAQVPHRRNQPQPHALARRKIKRPRVSIGTFAPQELLDRPMRQVAGRDRVRHFASIMPARAPALGQMHFEKCAMRSRKPAEWAQRLHHSGAVRPAAARAAAQRHHCDLHRPRALPRRACGTSRLPLAARRRVAPAPHPQSAPLPAAGSAQPRYAPRATPPEFVHAGSDRIRSASSSESNVSACSLAAIAVRQQPVEKAPRAVASARQHRATAR